MLDLPYLHEPNGTEPKKRTPGGLTNRCEYLTVNQMPANLTHRCDRSTAGHAAIEYVGLGLIYTSSHLLLLGLSVVENRIKTLRTVKRLSTSRETETYEVQIAHSFEPIMHMPHRKPTIIRAPKRMGSISEPPELSVSIPEQHATSSRASTMRNATIRFSMGSNRDLGGVPRSEDDHKWMTGSENGRTSPDRLSIASDRAYNAVFQ